MATPVEIVPPQIIAAKIKEVGERIGRDFPDHDLVLVGMLKGAAVFLADLLRAIPRQVRLELVTVARQGAPRGEIIELSYATQVNIQGAHAIILKDICHSGVTENYLLTHLAQQDPRTLEVAALVNRPLLRRVALQPRYVLLDEVPEGRLVGYGMEYQGRWGNLPGIYLLEGG